MSLAAALEWHPREIEECSMWELAAYADGMNRTNGKQEPMSDGEFDDLLAAHNIG